MPDEREVHQGQAEVSYEGTVVNKSDLYGFLLARQESGSKNATVAKSLATRAWNELGQMAQYPNLGLRFGQVVPTGIMKPRSSYKGRGWAEREVVNYIDLDLSSLVECVNWYQGMREKNQLPESRAMDAVMDFVDYAKDHYGTQ
jgi:hypothetical protein